ncbi:uncharacterized protein [Amphiura filiformis]|uniref:uncharacterized protein n=1 Tax=Amphiura filiformis TaxID=82378 RepID=UPI003B21098E
MIFSSFEQSKITVTQLVKVYLKHDQQKGDTTESKSWLSWLYRHILQIIADKKASVKEKEQLFQYLSSNQTDLFELKSIVKVILAVLETLEMSTIENIVEEFFLWDKLIEWSFRGGRLSLKLQESQKFLRVCTLLQDIKGNIETKQLQLDDSVWGILETEQKKNTLVELVTCLLGQDAIVFKSELSEICSMKTEYVKHRSTCDVFLTNINFADHFIKKEDMKIITKANKKYKTGRICDIEIIDKDVCTFLDNIHGVESTLESVIFQNVAFTKLSAITQTEEVSEKANLTLSVFATYLVDDCCKEYHFILEKIVTRNYMVDSQTLLKDMLEVMKNIDTPEKLKKEIQLIQDIHSHPKTDLNELVINENVHSDLKELVMFEEYQQHQSLLRSVLLTVYPGTEQDIEKMTALTSDINQSVGTWLDNIPTLSWFKKKLKKENKHEYMFEFLEEMAKSKALLHFLREIRDEDLMNVADALGKFSDEWLKLMDLKEQMMPFLEREKISVVRFMAILRQQICVPPLDIKKGKGKTDTQQISERPSDIKNEKEKTCIKSLVVECNHNIYLIQDVYKSIATYGKLDSYIIRASVQQGGRFCFTRNRSTNTYDIILEYPKQNPKVNQNENPKENSTDDPKVNPKENQKQYPKENQKQNPKVRPKENPKLNPKGNPKENPNENPKQDPKDNLKGNPKESQKGIANKNSKENQNENQKMKENPHQESQYGICSSELLDDIRNRALLNCSFELQTETDKEVRSEAAKFLENINRAYEIAELYSQLDDAVGFIEGPLWEPVSTLNLQDAHNKLQGELETWESTLLKERAEHFCLNYFTSRQLWDLYRYIDGKISFSEDIKTLLHFICPHADLQTEPKVPDFKSSLLNTMPIQKKSLVTIACYLDTFIEQNGRQEIIHRSITQLGDDITTNPDYSIVEPGDIFVAYYDVDARSIDNILTLMTLCACTTRTYPEPSEIMFCQQQTSTEDITLFLARCWGSVAGKTILSKRPYFLVDVENLRDEVQIDLIEGIKRLQNTAKSNSDVMLAILCRGNRYHPVVQHFPSCNVRKVKPMAEEEMKRSLQTDNPNIKIVTSDHAGQGKTNYVFKRSTNQMSVKSVLIGATMNKVELLTYIKDMTRNSTEHDDLHFDITSLEKPQIFDELIFELAIVGMITVGDVFFKWYGKRIYLEIANTFDNYLCGSLSLCRMFRNHHIRWQNLDDLVISTNIGSPIQVVCRYKQALDKRTLDKTQIQIPMKIDENQTDENEAEVIDQTRCRLILLELFNKQQPMSYTAVHAFLKVLAKSLEHFTRSDFFSIPTLEWSMKTRFSFLIHKIKPLRIRSSLVKIIFQSAFEVMKQFESKRSGLSFPRLPNATRLENRMKGVIEWHKSNHELVIFNRQDLNTIHILYRVVSDVPDSIKTYFESQNASLPDYENLSEADLKKTLQIMCRTTDKPFDEAAFLQKHGELMSHYVVTPDNMLKMMLILMRINARVPVIIQGETGCGKTLLIKYLAAISDATFEIINVHAGTTLTEISEFVERCKVSATKTDGDRRTESEVINVHAGTKLLSTTKTDRDNRTQREVWAYFDEINTSTLLGTLNEIVCHHRFDGQDLPPNLVCIASCNPYKKRDKESTNAGLKQPGIDESGYIDNLVYRVHPPPGTMLDFIWDFGSLNKKDEKVYIERMVHGTISERINPIFVNLLVESQAFIRQYENTSYCVSLRDVNRCSKVANWMINVFLKNKGMAKLRKAVSETVYEEENYRGMILAFAVCYHSRLAKEEDRSKYRKFLASKCGFKCNYVDGVIEAEQSDLLAVMDLPEGIARNKAMKENVFVLLAAIMNKIPVFIVGKPGSSKSLSVNILESHLKGQQSKKQFFKTLPKIYKLSFQGTESSTSEGIQKIFDTAETYRANGRYPVVLLDEIGLAERSKCNPLKVLHSLLDPNKTGFPSVAVIGISNWTLDAAKMNRAVILSRPDPIKADLEETAEAINKHNRGTGYSKEHTTDVVKLVEGYHAYKSKKFDIKIRADFHGLRDFYSMVKYATTNASIPGSIERSVRRNFGGLREVETSEVYNTITRKYHDTITCEKEGDLRNTVLNLIDECLQDETSRHLMIITQNDDSAVSILTQSVMKTNYTVLYGSQYENDCTPVYDHLILRKIIIQMENEGTLVLRNLERIYGGLYDMLNQNYREVKQSKRCRVALGPFANHICIVHPKFKCIVLVNEDDVEQGRCDPPFLNRFEKQRVNFSDAMNESQYNIVVEVRKWVQDVTTLKQDQLTFTLKESIIGFNDDMIPSMVMKLDKTLPDLSIYTTNYKNQLIQVCTTCILRMMCSDAILRLPLSVFALDQKDESVTTILEIKEKYFNYPLHEGIAVLMQSIVMDENATRFFNTLNKEITQDGSKLVLYTFSTFHTDLTKILMNADGCLTYQIERLSNFKSYNQLDKRLRTFWLLSSTKMLVIQCNTLNDSKHVLLAKSLVDQYRLEYNNGTLCKDRGVKHVCFIFHVDRNTDTCKKQPWMFNFSGGWEPFTIETLEPHPYAVTSPRSSSIGSVVDSCVADIMTEQLLWCFAQISYEHKEKSRELSEVKALVQTMSQNATIVNELAQKVALCVREKEKKSLEATQKSWEENVASDLSLLREWFSHAEARKHYIKSYIRDSIAKVVFAVEKLDAWSSLMSRPGNNELWACFFANEKIFSPTLFDISSPQCSESYKIEKPLLHYQFPFFNLFHEEIQSYQSLVLDHVAVDSAFSTKRLSEQLAKMIKQKYPELEDVQGGLFEDDFIKMVSSNFLPECDLDHRITTTKWFLMKNGLAGVIDVTQPYVQIARCYVAFWTDHMLPRVVGLIAKSCIWKDIQIDQILSSIDQTLGSLDNSANRDHRQINIEDQTGENFSSVVPEVRLLAGMHEEYTHCEEICYLLVSGVCKKVLPIRENVELCGGIDEWQKKASIIASHATFVNSDSPWLHFLTLCIDVSRLLILKSQQTCANDLQKLAESALKTDGIDIERKTTFLLSRTTFEAFVNLLGNVEGRENDDLVCLYIGRCLEVDPNTELLPTFISIIRNETTHGLISGARAVIYTLINMDLSESLYFHKDDVESCWRSILSPKSLLELNMKCLETLDRYLVNQVAAFDCPFNIVCYDVLQEFLFEHVTQGSDFTWQDISDVVLKTISSATKMSMKFLCAIAYVRTVFKVFSTHFEGMVDNTVFYTETVSMAIGKLLPSTTNPRLNALKYHFVSSMDKCKVRSSEPEKYAEYLSAKYFPTLQEYRREQSSNMRYLNYNPLAYAKKFNEVCQAFATGKEDQLRGKLGEVEYRLAFVGLIIDKLYLQRPTKRFFEQENTELKDKLMAWFTQERSEHHPFTDFVDRLIETSSHDKHATLKPTWLKLQPESLMKDVHKASVVVHIGAIIYSGDISGAFLQLLTRPVRISNLYLPASGIPTVTFENMKKPLPEVFQYNCKCGQTCVVGVAQKDLLSKCSSCRSDIIKDRLREVHVSKNTMRYSDQKGYHCSKDSSVDHQSLLLGIRSLSPVTYRIIKLLFNCSALLGCCIDKSVKHSISKAIRPEGHASTDKIHLERVRIFLSESIDMDFEALTKLLNLDYEEVTMLLHAILRESMNIISDPANRYHWTDQTDRNRFEQNLALIIEKTVRGMHREIHTFKQESSKTPHLLCFNTDVDRLLLDMPSASFEDCRASFLSQGPHSFQSHPFLYLIFRRCGVLSYLKYLPALLKWNFYISNLLRYRIDSLTAETRTHRDILQDLQCQTGKDYYETKFNEFENAWNEVCKGWKTGKDEEPQLMSLDTPVIASLLPRRKPRNDMKRIIETLQEAQNDFLNEVAALALNHYEFCLDVITKDDNTVCIPWVDLKLRRRNGIIRFSEKSVCILYHDLDCNPVLRNQYDFGQIEKKIVEDVIIHSAFLTSENLFGSFEFTDDIFHTCTAILFDVEAAVEQKELDIDVSESLDRHSAPNLLELLEIALVFLKRTGGDPNELLSQYIESSYSNYAVSKIKTILCQNTSIRLKHIVDLYLKVEDIVAEDKSKTVPRQYQLPLDKKTKNALEDRCMKSDLNDADLKQVSTILKRFMCRYLRSFKVNPSEKLLHVLLDDEFRVISDMKEDIQKNIQFVVKEGLTVANTKAVADIIAEALQKRKPILSKRPKPKGGKFRLQVSW